MQIKNREQVYKGYFSIDRLDVETKKGNIVKREVMVRKDAVAALVYNTKTNKYIFVKQWRPGPDKQIIEIPAGTLDVPGEDPADAMKREILEEIGYETDTIDKITDFYLSPGGTTEKIYIYIATVSNKVAEGGGLENEDIDIVEIDEQDIYDFKSEDAKTAFALMYIQSFNNSL